MILVRSSNHIPNITHRYTLITKIRTVCAQTATSICILIIKISSNIKDLIDLMKSILLIKLSVSYYNNKAQIPLYSVCTLAVLSGLCSSLTYLQNQKTPTSEGQEPLCCCRNPQCLQTWFVLEKKHEDLTMLTVHIVRYVQLQNVWQTTVCSLRPKYEKWYTHNFHPIHK